MRKIKLNERQILMLQKLQQKESKENKILRITESQYNRLFKGKGKAVKKLDKSIKKAGLDENDTKKIDLVDFAQEVIVFVKDILSKSNHRKMNFSPYWSELGLSKNDLFKLVKKHGLLTLANEDTEIREYAAPKYGFRKKIKELYKQISEFGDAGYPAGAEHDSNAPWNQPDGDGEPQEEIIRLDDSEKKFKLLYMEPQDGLSIFKSGNELFVASLSDIGGINEDPEVFDNKVYLYDYEKHTDNITPLGFEDYINDAYNDGEIKPVRNDKTDKFPVPTLITPIVKKRILGWYGDDPKLGQILGQLPETTGAASSGAYVGGSSFGNTINKDTGMSPSQAMRDLSEGKWAVMMKGVRSNPQGPFTVVAIENGKVVAQKTNITIPDSIPAYYEAAKRKFPNAKISIENGEGLSVYNESKSEDEILGELNIAESSESDKLSQLISHAINQVDESLSYKDFAVAVANILADSYGKHLFMPFLEVLTNSLPIDLGETTSTGSVGAGVGANGQGTQTDPQYAYDAPAGDGKDFWTAGNKLNKKMGTKGTPIVRGGKMNEGIKVGQVYKNGLARRKVKDIKKHPLTQSKKVIVVQQWGDGNNREINIDPKEWGNWELLVEKRILRVTEEQFKRIVESENLNKTAYPNGEMVSFDDCTKLNNNKVAQNGGCSQGDDGVVKTTKTKGSVVSKKTNS